MVWEEQPLIRKNKQISEKVTLFFPRCPSQEPPMARNGAFSAGVAELRDLKGF